MAKNLRKKLPASETLRVFDINQASVDALVKEAEEAPPGGAAVEVSGSALEAAKDSVRVNPRISSIPRGFELPGSKRALS